MVTRIYEVLTVPDKRLKIKAQPVVHVNDEAREILDRMVETMYHYDGVGLAATQVGINKRLVVMEIMDEVTNTTTLYKMVNPQVLWFSEEKELMPEACLSVPGQYAEVQRSTSIKASYQDETGQEFKVEVTGLMAHCIQHETEHLDGILYIDHLSPLKRKLITQRAVKAQRELKDQRAHAKLL
jgi:peptide deformylase